MENKTILDPSLVGAFFQGIIEANTKLFELSSVYLSEHKRKYCKGNQVIIENEKLINRPEDIPTHEIILVEGNLVDTFHQITVRNLSTNEETTIQL